MRKQNSNLMNATKRQRNWTAIAKASVLATSAGVLAAAAMAQTTPTPAPAPAPAPKMDKAMPPAAAAGSNAPTSSQSIDALFKRIDTDADGSLSKTELEKFDPEAAKSFEKYDTDKDSKLSLSEFDAMVKGLRAS